jgi:hypothetical protein
MTPTRRTLLISALVLLSIASIIFGFLGAWQIASTGQVPDTLSAAPQADPLPPIQVTINALILNGTAAPAPQADAQAETATTAEGLAHAFLTTDMAPAWRILQAHPSLQPITAQETAERAVAAIQTEAATSGWSIAVAVMNEQGKRIGLASTERHVRP